MKKEEKKPKFTRGIILSANFGGYDPETPWPAQERLLLTKAGSGGMKGGVTQVKEQVDFTIERYNDENFPYRGLALTPRMKPALIKMFGWEFAPNCEYYIWVDASKTLASSDFGAWMVQQLGRAEFAVFRHPERNSIKAEYEFVKRKMEEGNQYLLERYSGEFLDEQYKVIERDRTYADEVLYASTGFIYRPLKHVKAALKEWWHHKTRFLLHDQLALPYVLWQHKVKVHVIEENIYKFPLWEHTRKPRRRRVDK